MGQSLTIYELNGEIQEIFGFLWVQRCPILKSYHVIPRKITRAGQVSPNPVDGPAKSQSPVGRWAKSHDRWFIP